MTSFPNITQPVMLSAQEVYEALLANGWTETYGNHWNPPGTTDDQHADVDATKAFRLLLKSKNIL